jgi:hypothetical protein
VALFAGPDFIQYQLDFGASFHAAGIVDVGYMACDDGPFIGYDFAVYNDRFPSGGP